MALDASEWDFMGLESGENVIETHRKFRNNASKPNKIKG